MDIVLRDYGRDGDFEAIVRIWREVGWLGRGEEEGMRYYLDGSRGMVADVDGNPECFVLTTDGAIRYLDEDLPLCAVTGVTTGRVARRLGLARRLLARALAHDAARGAAVSALGVFEQGFYDALGYGTGTYIVNATFDPAQIRVSMKPRVPVRLTGDDWQALHAARLARRRLHGGCNLYPSGITHMESSGRNKWFGLGYRDGKDGEITHYLWCYTENVERGPYESELIFQTREQLLELLAVLKSLADQIVCASLREPPGVQLQDLLDRPLRQMALTRGGKHEARIRASAYWQVRIMDLRACLARTHLPGASVEFNLKLTDPIESFAHETGWHGLGGEYVVTLGPESSCREGEDARLPVLHASVGAFSRMWFGVRPASGLAMTDSLRGPESLMKELDRVVRVPQPQPDWDF